MSFFNKNMLLLKKMQEINDAIENANNKVKQLDNFDYETITMGNYRLKNNVETDTLDIEYIDS